jgi:hypothetical protein
LLDSEVNSLSWVIAFGPLGELDIHERASSFHKLWASLGLWP